MLKLLLTWLLALAPVFYGTVGKSGDRIANGWRGNGTGLWPDAEVPLEWHRLPRGALEDMRASAEPPSAVDNGRAAATAPVVRKGLLRDWLVIGPFAVEDSVADFDRDLLGHEAEMSPRPGQEIAGKTWQSATVPADDFMVFGTAELPWLDLSKTWGFALNQIGYAHTYVHSPLGGKAAVIVDHGHGLAAWVNGKQVYHQPQRAITLGYYTQISAHELKHLDHRSPRFDVELLPGWNRFLLKLSTSNKDGFTDMRASLRIVDPLDVPYENKNIRWMTPLPGRSTSTPILVGSRLLVMAEPDELLCLDKESGRILWSRRINYYEALSTEDKAARPEYAKRIDPLFAALDAEVDGSRRFALRGRIAATLEEMDAERFQLKPNGHFESHFGIVGFTMPTPVSDGERVWVWSGLGVAACFDLEGNRRWITRVETGELTYGSSPCLAEGVLAVYLNKLFGLDADSGAVLWEQPKVQHNVASLLAAELGGQNVIVTQRGYVVRPSDGELLYVPRGMGTGDEGWSPPLILADTLYLPRYGVTTLFELDFSGGPPEEVGPGLVKTMSLPGEVSRLPGGGWIDRWTAGSPLVWQGVAYQNDIYQSLYAVDLKTGEMLHRQELELEGFTHYNAVAVAASPTLFGRHLFLQDNQGTTLVLEPGPSYKVVARNRIATQLDRKWPLPAQETLSYSPPITDGRRIYLRGEANLYCVGE